MLEALAAGILALLLLWLVVQPILFPAAVTGEYYEPPDPEETPRGQALLALKEIEFDRATGKLSDEDFTQLHDKYSAAAIALLDAAPAAVAGDDPVEAMIAARVASLRDTVAAPAAGAPLCLVHGPRSEADARFCNLCGAGLVRADGGCVACGTPVPADASFCPGCGVKVRA